MKRLSSGCDNVGMEVMSTGVTDLIGVMIRISKGLKLQPLLCLSRGLEDYGFVVEWYEKKKKTTV